MGVPGAARAAAGSALPPSIRPQRSRPTTGTWLQLCRPWTLDTNLFRRSQVCLVSSQRSSRRRNPGRTGRAAGTHSRARPDDAQACGRGAARLLEGMSPLQSIRNDPDVVSFGYSFHLVDDSSNRGGSLQRSRHRRGGGFTARTADSLVLAISQRRDQRRLPTLRASIMSRHRVSMAQARRTNRFSWRRGTRSPGHGGWPRDYSAYRLEGQS